MNKRVADLPSCFAVKLQRAYDARTRLAPAERALNRRNLTAPRPSHLRVNPVTHALTGWCLAEAIPNVTTREKALITIAAIAPDVDGLGMFVELATRNGPRPLFWWTDYHHLLGHNLLFAIAASLVAAVAARTKRATTAACVFIAVHLHILGDLVGSRGPDGYQWPIPYLYPLDNGPQLVWSGQWRLNAWPNIAFTIALLAITMFLAWKRGYSIVGLLSQRADRAFVDALRLRVRRSFCSHG